MILELKSGIIKAQAWCCAQGQQLAAEEAGGGAASPPHVALGFGSDVRLWAPFKVQTSNFKSGHDCTGTTGHPLRSVETCKLNSVAENGLQTMGKKGRDEQPAIARLMRHRDTAQSQ